MRDDADERRQKTLGRQRRRLAPLVVAYIALIYVFASSAAFRIRHPWMTETQLLGHAVDAWMWRDVPKENQ